MTFEEMKLSPEVMSGLKDVNYSEPTEIQQAVIPLVLEGKDVLAKNEDKEGHYGSFIIPALEKVNASKEDESTGTRVLILTPNPETASDIDELIWAMGYHAEVQSATIGIDGDLEEQQKDIMNGTPVIVANPGRLAEILQENRVVMRDIELLVLDKLEEMASLNLADKLEDIQKRIISDYQTLAYTAELNDEVKKLADMFVSESEVIGFENIRSNGQLTDAPPQISGHLDQAYIKVPNRMKITTLMAYIDSGSFDKCVIFCASKRGTDRLYRVLRKQDYTATSLHERLSEEKRSQRFANFKDGDVRFLLVADVSAADLDLENVQHVINYDVPNDPDEYRYRAGLVERGGESSRILSLVSKQDRSDINQLSDELGEAPQEIPLPEKVKEKIKQRKSQGKGKTSTKEKSKEKRGRPKQQRGKKREERVKEKKKEKELELPRPSYDKLSGGRSGNKEDDGVVGFFKKLFSSSPDKEN